MSDCCLIKKVATVEVYENKNEVRAYGFMAGDKNTPMMEVKFRHLWGEENLSKCRLRWIIVDDLGSLLVGEVPIEQDNTASIQLPNELFTGERRMKVQLTVASCDGSRILNLQQFTDLKVINNLASNEVVEPVYDILINKLYEGDLTFILDNFNTLKAEYQKNNALLNEALNGMVTNSRLTSNSITSDKLRIAEDSSKIKLINLSDEVIKALSGDATLRPTIGAKEITTDKLADASVTTEQLADSFNYRGRLGAGDDLNTCKKDGVFLVDPPVLNSPFPGATLVLDQKLAGSENRFLLQTVYVYGDTQKEATRCLDTVNADGETKKWKYTIDSIESKSITTDKLADKSITTDKLADKSITTDKLADNFSYVDKILTGNDLNEIVKDGVYLVNPGVLNSPFDTKVCILRTELIQNRFLNQRVNVYGDTQKEATRCLDTVNADGETKKWAFPNDVSKTEISTLKTELEKIKAENEELKKYNDLTNERILEIEDRNPLENFVLDKAYITIVHDDIRADCAERFIEIFKNKNVPLSIAGVANRLSQMVDSGKTQIEVVNELLKDTKNEFLGHTFSHLPINGNNTVAQVEKELGFALVEYAKYGLRPQGTMLAGGRDSQGVYSSANYDDVGFGYIARKYYKYGDSVANTTIQHNWRREFIGDRTLAEHKARIDQIVATKEWVRYFHHNFTEFSELDLIELIDYVKSKGSDKIEFVTYKTMYQKLKDANV